MCQASDRMLLHRRYDDAADLQKRQEMTDVYVERSRRRLKRLQELSAPPAIIEGEEKHLAALEKKKRSRTRIYQPH